MSHVFCIKVFVNRLSGTENPSIPLGININFSLACVCITVPFVVLRSLFLCDRYLAHFYEYTVYCLATTWHHLRLLIHCLYYAIQKYILQ